MSRWPMADGWLQLAGIESGGIWLQAGGSWDARNVTRLDGELRGLVPEFSEPLTFDLAQVKRLDTAGAWLLYRTLKDLRERGLQADYAGVTAEHAAMLETVAANDHP